MNNFKENSGDVFASVGAPAPDFILPTQSGVEWRLSEQTGKIIVLLFYPKNETLVCTRQLCSVRDNWAEYLKTKAVIVGISSGTVEEHRQFSSNHQLPLPLLADENRRVTKLYVRHKFFPISFLRTIVVIDARGIVRSRKTMLRAFRPQDAEVLKTIRSAHLDAMIHWA